MLIDKIIVAKTDFTPYQFTGGAVQYSVSKHTKKLTVTLVLYFGFNDKNTSIYEKIEIQEKDIDTINKELLLKAKTYKESLIDSKLILSLDDLVNVSHESSTTRNESSTTIAKNLSVSNDKKVLDKVDIDIDEGKFNASFHFAPLSELVSQLKTKKDTQKHKPLKTIKEFDNYLKDFPYETEAEKNTVDDVLNIGYMFIKYRDYMFSLTKETKYRLLTSKSVEDFIDVIYSDFKDIDVESLFDKMEAKGWASLQKGKGWKL